MLQPGSQGNKSQVCILLCEVKDQTNYLQLQLKPNLYIDILVDKSQTAYKTWAT